MSKNTASYPPFLRFSSLLVTSRSPMRQSLTCVAAHANRELAVGPILILCMIVAEAQSVGAAHGLNALQSALVLSFWSGILQIALGVMGMGYVVSVISQAAVSGFCSAVGIVVMFSQAGLLLGLKVADSVVCPIEFSLSAVARSPRFSVQCSEVGRFGVG